MLSCQKLATAVFQANSGKRLIIYRVCLAAIAVSATKNCRKKFIEIISYERKIEPIH